MSMGVGAIVGCAVTAAVLPATARQPIIPPVPTALAVLHSICHARSETAVGYLCCERQVVVCRRE